MKFLLTVVLMALLTGCNGMNVQQFENAKLKLSLEQYFAGTTHAWGVFEDRFGQLRRQFRVTIEGRMEGDILVLDEHFEYADGEQDRRIWRIKTLGANRYQGSAEDIIGTAEGEIAGNALHWRYQMNLAVGDSSYRVHFDDWMWLQPGGVMINRATVSKWGFDLGTVTLFFSKQDHPS
ncbi:MAG: hypothetical protein ACI9W6_000907 [Motiliproteus sp.]|jgi:hypothetical protein